MQANASRIGSLFGRRARCSAVLALVACLVFTFALFGCGSSTAADSSAASSGESGGSSAAATQTVKVGTMPTEDILPLWVAEQQGLFAPNGVEVEIVSFDSAPSLSAAITAGQVDMAMTDIMRAEKLCESGTDVTMEWITLGATPEQGRFGVQVAADSGIASLEDLVSSSVGVAANTVPEYVFDKLCEQAGIDPASIEHVEVASLPERFGLMANGTTGAAALPASLLALGEAQGMITIADDTTGENISQSVMVARTAWAAENAAALEGVARAWDDAVALIDADPASFRELLVEKANLNDSIADSYPISTYPTALIEAADGTVELARVPQELVEPVIAWMQEKGYTEVATVGYDEETGAFTLA